MVVTALLWYKLSVIVTNYDNLFVSLLKNMSVWQFGIEIAGLKTKQKILLKHKNRINYGS